MPKADACSFDHVVGRLPLDCVCSLEVPVLGVLVAFEVLDVFSLVLAECVLDLDVDVSVTGFVGRVPGPLLSVAVGVCLLDHVVGRLPLDCVCSLEVPVLGVLVAFEVLDVFSLVLAECVLDLDVDVSVTGFVGRVPGPLLSVAVGVCLLDHVVGRLPLDCVCSLEVPVLGVLVAFEVLDVFSLVLAECVLDLEVDVSVTGLVGGVPEPLLSVAVGVCLLDHVVGRLPLDCVCSLEVPVLGVLVAFEVLDVFSLVLAECVLDLEVDVSVTGLVGGVPEPLLSVAVGVCLLDHVVGRLPLDCVCSLEVPVLGVLVAFEVLDALLLVLTTANLILELYISVTGLVGRVPGPLLSVAVGVCLLDHVVGRLPLDCVCSLEVPVLGVLVAFELLAWLVVYQDLYFQWQLAFVCLTMWLVDYH
ncbi:PREDICTED: uncharacterized protein LOC108570295 [Habropoda laboriosa]|uniref:uncharacterized protein LOC108570295 n=1 Tax=Habropoda laboriosa TaxID=597456 RepID=UPI00083E5CDC|nr:PREDICTED: uncharacterized protein LOC108570295 [Habropoda laboriosa]